MMSLKHYIIALGIVLLTTPSYNNNLANAQLCDGDNDVLSHNAEFEVRLTCGDPGISSEFGLQFSADAGPYANLHIDGWSIDFDHDLMCPQLLKVDSYSSYDTTYPGTAVNKPENLDLVNWLINQYPVGSSDSVNIPSCSFNDPLESGHHQVAIWTLLDYSIFQGNFSEWGDCVVDWLVDQAEANGEGYEPSCNDTDAKIAVILIVDDDNNSSDTSEELMAEVSLADIDGICECNNSGNVMGDPHFKTWSGELYDFHGICDLVLLHNPNFQNGLGMNIHIRSKKMKEFSYISTAVIKIGSETFEVAGHKDGNTYWLNGKQGPSDGTFTNNNNKEGTTTTIAGFLMTFRQVHSHQREYIIHISNQEKIVFVTWRDFVRIDIKHASTQNFHGSLGLMGSFDQRGVKLGRDGASTFDEINEFGMEWQVLAQEEETNLFHTVDGPQHPAMCEIPTKMALRRRLSESIMTQEEAESACSRVKKRETRDLCIFDVMATNNRDVAEAYY